MTICALILLALPTAEARSQTIATTYWLNPEHGWILESRACPTGLCAFIVALRGTEPAAIPRDTHNRDAALRSRPLCGLQLMGGFDESKRKGNSADGGWVYDPDSGETYDANLTLKNPDTVNVRGYVGLPMFGRTITLRRQDDPGQRCAMPSRPGAAPSSVQPPTR